VSRGRAMGTPFQVLSCVRCVGLHGGGREGAERDFGDGVHWHVMASTVGLVVVVVDGMSLLLGGSVAQQNHQAT
jgi:hypothetical protein